MKTKKLSIFLTILFFGSCLLFNSCGASEINGDWSCIEDGVVVEGYSFKNGKYTQSVFFLFTYVTLRGEYTVDSNYVEYIPSEYFDYDDMQWHPVTEDEIEEYSGNFTYSKIDKDTLSITGTVWGGEDEEVIFKKGPFQEKINDLF